MCRKTVDGRRSTVDRGIAAHRRLVLGVGGARLIILAMVLMAGCSFFTRGPAIDESIKLVAVMPIERDEPSSGALLPGAENVVTAQIYGVLSSSPEWHFVPDLSVVQALKQIPRTGDLALRARALGTAVNAEGVIFGTVSRYIEREGSEYGARSPAAVSFKLNLISVSSGNILWSGSFEEQQQPLSSNLFNWWQFWKGGPRWFTAKEFTRLGVERLLSQLGGKLGY